MEIPGARNEQGDRVLHIICVRLVTAVKEKSQRQSGLWPSYLLSVKYHLCLGWQFGTVCNEPGRIVILKFVLPSLRLTGGASRGRCDGLSGAEDAGWFGPHSLCVERMIVSRAAHGIGYSKIRCDGQDASGHDISAFLTGNAGFTRWSR